MCAKSGMATTIMITVDICKWRETKYCKVVELLMGEFHCDLLICIFKF